MDWLIPAFIVTGLVALFWFAMSRHYGKILAAEPFEEVARLGKDENQRADKCHGKGGAAVADIGRPTRSADQCRTGNRLHHHPETEGFVHHSFINLPGHSTPSAVRRTFTPYITRLLEVPLYQLMMEVSPAGVHHAEFTLTPEEAAFAPIRLRYPQQRKHGKFIKECQKVRAESDE